jgi:hypothetical protein
MAIQMISCRVQGALLAGMEDAWPPIPSEQADRLLDWNDICWERVGKGLQAG